MRKIPALPLQLLCLILAANAGSAADYAAGYAAFSTGDYDTALAEWAPLAEQGDANSQFGLGILYANGWGVPLDDAKALKWYESAANQGHAEAQYNLGVMYQNGWGVPQGDAEAFNWVQMAADGGFPAAHRALADMYTNGIGVEIDLVQACKWYETGATLGDSESNFDLQDLEMSMNPADIAAAQELADAWLDDFRNRRPDYAWPGDG